MRYWIGVAAKDHVARGVEGGFCQLCHGRAQPLQRMSRGDGIIYYSPKQRFSGAEVCQEFTAIGHVVGDAVYAVPMAADFVPFRRDIKFLQGQAVAIRRILGCRSSTGGSWLLTCIGSETSSTWYSNRRGR